VIDLSPTRVGAQVTQTLADFGAEVVWVEPPGGSALRSQSCFPFLARGKHSIVADLTSTDGVRTLRELAASADVVVETFRPGTSERLGVGYADLAETNPGLVHASITGFGRQGPWTNVKGYEGVVAAVVDGWVFLAVLQADEREALAKVVHVRNDARFATEAHRLANDEALTAQSRHCVRLSQQGSLGEDADRRRRRLCCHQPGSPRDAIHG
jgi:crotonobetainyl-CoA:carnitine CoA-transferase CaiB-like acyl-CoA transferase